MIILMRHGQVRQSGATWIKPDGLRDHIAGYNNAPIMPPTDTFPPPCDTPFIVCSTLRRSTESARLGFGRYDQTDALFDEAGLPDIHLPPLPLPAGVLMVLARVRWFLGADRPCESYTAFKDRAREAADALITIANTRECVVLVGHGILNRHIAQHLRLNGYAGPKHPDSKHWSCTPYTRAHSAD